MLFGSPTVVAGDNAPSVMGELVVSWSGARFASPVPRRLGSFHIFGIS